MQQPFLAINIVILFLGLVSGIAVGYFAGLDRAQRRASDTLQRANRITRIWKTHNHRSALEHYMPDTTMRVERLSREEVEHRYPVFTNRPGQRIHDAVPTPMPIVEVPSWVTDLCDQVSEEDEPALCVCGGHYLGAPCPVLLQEKYLFNIRNKKG